MDIHLAGEMDGIETAEQVRTRYSIPVVFLTAHADDTSLERAKVTQPYGYILKPFDERELHSAIEMALYKHRMELMAEEHARTLRILANAIPDPVVLLDSEKQVIALNDAMANRLGGSISAVADNVSVLFDKYGEFTSLGHQIDDAVSSGHPVHFEEVAGEEWFDVSIHPLTETGPENRWGLVHYHSITDHKRFEEQIKREGLTRIEHNMEQFQILNDQIRNPLQAIMGYINLDCVKFRDKISEQISVIDKLVDQLDHGWVESEKVRQFLLRHYHDSPTAKPPSGPRSNEGRDR